MKKSCRMLQNVNKAFVEIGIKSMPFCKQNGKCAEDEEES